VPDPRRAEAEDLLTRRTEARARGDFAEADRLRERLGELGFDVADRPDGSILTERETAAPRAARTSEHVESVLGEQATVDVSMQWVVQGWPADVVRGIASFDEHRGEASVEHVVVDATGTDPERWPAEADIVPVAAGMGWGAARNAGLRRTRGRVVVIVDGSVEATGPWTEPILETLADASVGVAGPFGLVTDDLRSFHEAPGPDVDAIEGYLMALRRDLLLEGVRFDEKFRFYRMADVEASFQVKARGLRAVVVPVPVVRHEHRAWSSTTPEERDRLSKHNYYRFLDRWRGRHDLTVAGG
jgi:cysteinyl-tRNA synthetase